MTRVDGSFFFLRPPFHLHSPVGKFYCIVFKVPDLQSYPISNLTWPPVSKGLHPL